NRPMVWAASTTVKATPAVPTATPASSTDASPAQLLATSSTTVPEAATMATGRATSNTRPSPGPRARAGAGPQPGSPGGPRPRTRQPGGEHHQHSHRGHHRRQVDTHINTGGGGRGAHHPAGDRPQAPEGVHRGHDRDPETVLHTDSRNVLGDIDDGIGDTDEQ